MQAALMAAPKWTEAQRNEALSLFRSHGASEAARQTGIPGNTIRSWARRLGVESAHEIPPAIRTAVETSAVAAEARRLVLAELMAGRAQAILERMDEVLHKATQAEVVTAADVKHLASAVGTLIEKVQLLTGEATSRDENTGGLNLEQELHTWQAAQAEAAAVAKARDTL